jgi:hypothetical protein
MRSSPRRTLPSRGRGMEGRNNLPLPRPRTHTSASRQAPINASKAELTSDDICMVVVPEDWDSEDRDTESVMLESIAVNRGKPPSPLS